MSVAGGNTILVGVRNSLGSVKATLDHFSGMLNAHNLTVGRSLSAPVTRLCNLSKHV